MIWNCLNLTGVASILAWDGLDSSTSPRDFSMVAWNGLELPQLALGCLNSCLGWSGIASIIAWDGLYLPQLA